MKTDLLYIDQLDRPTVHRPAGQTYCTSASWTDLLYIDQLDRPTVHRPAGQTYCTSTSWTYLLYIDQLDRPTVHRPAGQTYCTSTSWTDLLYIDQLEIFSNIIPWWILSIIQCETLWSGSNHYTLSGKSLIFIINRFNNIILYFYCASLFNVILIHVNNFSLR